MKPPWMRGRSLSRNRFQYCVKQPPELPMACAYSHRMTGRLFTSPAACSSHHRGRTYIGQMISVAAVLAPPDSYCTHTGMGRHVQSYNINYHYHGKARQGLHSSCCFCNHITSYHIVSHHIVSHHIATRQHAIHRYLHKARRVSSPQPARH